MNKIVLVILLCVASVAQAKEPYIDKVQFVSDTKRNAMISEGFKKCNKAKFGTRGEHELCTKKAFKQADNAYPSRGYSYAEKNYSSLSKDQGVKKIAELSAIYQKARGAGRPEVGELTTNDMSIEAVWIQNNILGNKRASIGSEFYIPCKKQIYSSFDSLCSVGEGD